MKFVNNCNDRVYISIIHIDLIVYLFELLKYIFIKPHLAEMSFNNMYTLHLMKMVVEFFSFLVETGQYGQRLYNTLVGIG